MEHLIKLIRDNTEWLQTTEGDDIECISIENLEGILSMYFNEQIKISENE